MSTLLNLRLFFIRRELLARSQAHRAGYEWALAQLRIGIEGDDLQAIIDCGYSAFDRGVLDAIHDSGRAHHEYHPTLVIAPGA